MSKFKPNPKVFWKLSSSYVSEWDTSERKKLKKSYPEELNVLQSTGSASTVSSLCDLEMILTGNLPSGGSTSLSLYHISLHSIPVHLVTDYNSHILTQLMLKLSTLPILPIYHLPTQLQSLLQNREENQWTEELWSSKPMELFAFLKRDSNQVLKYVSDSD